MIYRLVYQTQDVPLELDDQAEKDYGRIIGSRMRRGNECMLDASTDQIDVWRVRPDGTRRKVAVYMAT